jgi:hypothetical protein
VGRFLARLAHTLKIMRAQSDPLANGSASPDASTLLINELWREVRDANVASKNSIWILDFKLPWRGQARANARVLLQRRAASSPLQALDCLAKES